VSKWTRKLNIFEYDKIIIPIHLGNHWCCAVINFKKKRFEYYDSLGGSNYACLKILRNFVKEDYLNKNKKEFDFTGWEDYMPSDIPQQTNGYDCGVFACKYADYVAKDQPFNFSQKHMRYFRKRIVLDIIRKAYSL